jgi:hypothetical protein
MSFYGTEGEFYSPREAGEFTRRYREAKINPIEGGFIGREKLQAILDQDGCMGIRVYLGLDEDNSMNLVFVGADAEQNDIMNVIVERIPKCPPNCSSLNELNS